jgi:hypothetical protein
MYESEVSILENYLNIYYIKLQYYMKYLLHLNVLYVIYKSYSAL